MSVKFNGAKKRTLSVILGLAVSASAFAQDDSMEREAVAERIKPVGSVYVVGQAAPVAEAAPAAKSGADIVAASCNACHGTGVLEAPKIGDKAAWEARMANGVDGLLATSIAGKGNMPPRGGASASDEELRAAIEHMLKESGIDAGGPVAAVVETTKEVVEKTKEAAETATQAVENAASGAMNMMSQAASAVTGGGDTGGADLAKGKTIYSTSCFACHGTGAAGAPKLGDVAAWAPRIAQGMDVMNDHAIRGFKGMPPKGGAMSLSDEDVKAAIAYMVDSSK